MTLVEIVVASTILFIVMTAILGLVLQTTNTGLLAKEKMVMNNAVNAYVERVQAMPFASVGVAGVITSGTLAAVETTTTGEFTTTIRPSVLDTDTIDALKVLKLDVTLSAPRMRDRHMQTDVIIRDRLRYVTQGLRSPATDPVVVWDAPPMAPLDSVVWGTQTEFGGSLQIAAHVTAAEGRTISSVQIRTDHGDLLQNFGGTPAEWTPQVREWSVPNFVWNTEQQDGTGTKVVSDGPRVLTLNVKDSEGVSISTSWRFIVDNESPGVPGVPTVTGQTASATTLGWTAATHGTGSVDHYELIPYRQGLTQTIDQSPVGYWTAGTTVTTPSLSGSVPTVPFARYWIQLRAIGPAPNSRTSGYVSITTPWVTRPSVEASATVSRSGNDYTTVVKLACSQPLFPITGVVTYKWQRSPSGAEGTWVDQTGATSTLTQNLPGPANHEVAIVYYRCVVTYTPAGYAGGTPETKTSNYVGPTGTATGALTEVW